MYGTHGTDIVGYSFNADEYCPSCTKGMFQQYAPFAPTLTEDVLEAAAKALGIDRQDERSYDSSEFPKVIFGSDVESDDERCGKCGESLIP